MPREVLERDWHRLRNGQPWGHYELRNLARQAADDFVEHLGPDGSIVNPEYLRVFSLYASQLDKSRTNYGFGVSYLKEAVDGDEHSIARAVATYVSKQNDWPDRATTIRKLEGKNRSRKLGDEERFLWNHLEGIDAAYKQEAIQWAERRVEAGTNVESVTGTNEEG
jgi:hypothetical protein